jgi:uncharacterized membrane protein YagU involved in acid resistance
MEDRIMRDLTIGAIAGATATVPMSVAMELLYDRLPAWQRYPLPPRLITRRLADLTELDGTLTERQTRGVVLGLHLLYGATVGSVFPSIARQVPLPPVATGIGYGLFVWTASYLGLLPALRLLRPATQHPRRRSVVMILAHVVWGAVLGLVSGWLMPQPPTPVYERTSTAP